MRPSLASPQKETFHLSFAKVFMIPKGEDKRLVLPPPCPPARQGGAALPRLPPASSRAWDRQSQQPPKASTSFGGRKSTAHSGSLCAVRKTPRDEELSRTPVPLLILAAAHSQTSPVMALVGCRALPCPAQPWLQLSF